ncbi:hypothetical protein KCU62_g34, partial [Aureobasidium sp. EXF-3399]
MFVNAQTHDELFFIGIFLSITSNSQTSNLSTKSEKLSACLALSQLLSGTHPSFWLHVWCLIRVCSKPQPPELRLSFC